jgi:hypothetical protein
LNQQSLIGIGTDAAVLAGYAQAVNERLGNIDFIFENVGDKDAFIRVKELDKTSSPSGYADMSAAKGWLESTPSIAQFTVVARGSLTRSFSLVSKQIGFFGSGVGGSTKINVSTAIRNKGDLRGPQIDIVAGGRRGWGFGFAEDKAQIAKKWGLPPDKTSNAESDTWGGRPGNV